MSPLLLLKQVLTLLVFLVLGWILVHFMAIFGLFFAVALPVLHLFFYPKIICFWCQLKGGPHKLAHSLVDAILAIIVTLFSIGVVLLEARILSHFGFPKPEKNISFEIPSEGRYRLGELIPLKIELQQVTTPINVIQADLSFDPEYLRVNTITTAGSFAKFFIQKDHNNELGYIRITGGLPNPGYVSSNRSLFATVYFQSLKSGATTVKYLNTSLTLANNGQGDNLLSSFPQVSYIITSEVIDQSELKLQQDLIIQEEESDDSLRSQLTFYEEKLAQSNNTGLVLGQTTSSLPSSRLTRFLDALARLDHAIVELWNSIIS